MKKILWSRGYKSGLTKWYMGFFTIVVIGFTSFIYLHIRNQTWDKFNFGVSQLGEEMLEELSELRDDLDDEEFDLSVLISNFVKKLDADEFGPIDWTPPLLENIKSEIDQELIDESIDNQLPDRGFVQIRNLISNRLIYQSPEIQKYGINFIEPDTNLWGYLPFQIKMDNGSLTKGLGYSGVKITKNYYVGLIPETDDDFTDENKIQQIKLTIYHIAEAIDRKGDSLYVEDKDELLDMIQGLNAWVYIYIYEEDRILWATREINRNEIYIPSVENISDMIILPREVIPKEYFYDISDIQDRDYRQYTLIYDLIPTYLYRFDLAVPTKSIRTHMNLLLFIFILGAALVIGIVWIGGYILTRRALQPVDDIIRSVKEITSKNLDKRLPIPNLENEIMRLVRTFNELLDRLAKSFKMQKSFIADASHELRTPLSIILSDIETALKNLQDTSKIKDSLNNSITEIERMARIVDDLHLLARTEAGQINVNKQQIRLDDVVMATVSRCQVLASKKEIQLNIKNVEVIEYLGDEELLIRALSNLVSNAIKYSNIRANVELEVFKKDAKAYFTVSDQGIGISSENHEKIFGRFYRVDSSRSRETGGSGLGLAIAKWICEIHSGTIRVTSEPNKGSKFTIELPLE